MRAEDLRASLLRLGFDEILARCEFPVPGSDVVCAVSGGADSTALLVLAAASGLRVSAVHVHHHLRPEADADADHVARLADLLGVQLRVNHVEVGLGPNLEARARAARYAVLPEAVMTGHTADDLAETVVLNMLRGAALDGLTPMRSTAVRRPLLHLRRSETRALCDALGLDVVMDSMNTDPRLRRVRVRSEVLPLLSEVAQRDMVEVLARQAALLDGDRALLESLASAIDATDARALTGAARPLAARAVRTWLAEQGVTPGPVASQALVERVLSVARCDATAADLVGGWRVARTTQRLRLERWNESEANKGADAKKGNRE